MREGLEFMSENGAELLELEGFDDIDIEFVKDTTRRKRIKSARAKIKHRVKLYNNKFGKKKLDKDKFGRLNSHAYIPEYMRRKKTNMRNKAGIKKNWKAADIRHRAEIESFEE